MISNYFKSGLRSLVKNKLSSAINILGLALAVGCCLVVFQFLDFSMHFDTFNKKLDNLFVVERVAQKDGSEKLWGNSPAPLGPMLKAAFPQIKNMARINYTGVVIKQGDNVFRENIAFADNAFYQMFDYPVKWGKKQQFTDADGIVLSEQLSTAFFGKENPVGKPLSVHFYNNGRETIEALTVKGVFEKDPDEASWNFQALVPYSKMTTLGMDHPGDWSESTNITFLEATNESALQPIKQQSKHFLDLYNAANKDDKIVGFNYQSLKTMAFHSYKVDNERFNSTHIAAYIMLLVIAVSTLLLVYFNYMNIAMASAATRLKEIGVREVMGSNRQQIILQFILENLVLCTIAVGVGLLLAKALFLPWFKQIVPVDLGKNLFTNYRTWGALLTLIIISALSGAAYPACYISGFKPVNIMKGQSQMGSRNRFRKALLGLQFFLTFLTLSIALAFVGETTYIKAQPWGYDPAGNVVVTLDKTANYDAFKGELQNNSKVRSVSGSVQPLGEWSKQLVIKAEGKDETVQSISALPGFATQLNIPILKGRDLNPQYPSDQTDAVLVNQAFLKQMHWTTGIGKNITYQDHRYQIVGEVNDFHYQDFQAPVGPFLIVGCKPTDVAFVYAKTSSGLFSNAHTDIEAVWKKVNPNLPFEYHYQEGVFDDYFKGFVQTSQVTGAASVIMVVICISGIFGLALLILGKKMKEISVRKVLGAGMGTIIKLINKEFIYAIGFALLFGLPLSWFLTSLLFSMLAPESSVSALPLILSFFGLIAMTVISVSWHIFKAHTSNPTRYLKEE